MPSDIYVELAKHLDKLPGGFPATEEKVEIRILKRLFSPDEAELAVHLTLIPETAGVVARRSGLEPDTAKQKLLAMARKGLILSHEREGREPLFMAAQFVIGIWEFHVNDLDPELIKDMRAYLPYLFEPEAWNAWPQLRTIPVNQSIKPELLTMEHERAAELVEHHQRFAVAPCICRKEHGMLGDGCDAPLDSCLVFGNAADYYLRNGLGREISREECLEILKQADEAGLVLQPSNSRKITNICCCCGCCCQVLKFLKQQPKPANLVSSPFIAAHDEKACTECGVCVERCQMDALSQDDSGAVNYDAERCIGCGLCVSTCPADALELKRKPFTVQKEVPLSFHETLFKLGRFRSTMSPISAVGMVAKSRWDRYRAKQ
jgi:electron transport complex protein RnfB